MKNLSLYKLSTRNEDEWTLEDTARIVANMVLNCLCGDGVKSKRLFLPMVCGLLEKKQARLFPKAAAKSARAKGG
jgi:hypothetical protein